jgi:hypothetical protein
MSTDKTDETSTAKCNTEEIGPNKMSNHGKGTDEEGVPKPYQWNHATEAIVRSEVCLITAARIPPRHMQVVKAAINGSYKPEMEPVFEPDQDIMESLGLTMDLALVRVRDDQQVALVVHNPSSNAVKISPGQILGQLGVAEECEEVSVCHLVSEEKVMGNASERARKVMESITLDDDMLQPGQYDQVKSLIFKSQHIFALSPAELGCTKITQHVINTGDNPPIKQPLRRVPFSLRGKTEEMVEEMLQQKVIKESTSPWASPVVLVKKKNGAIRFCVDYRPLQRRMSFRCHGSMMLWIF